MLDENGSLAPAGAVTRDTIGANGTVAVRLGGKMGSARVQLTMSGWGLLDETYATAVLQ